jgi:flavin-dependent dehydrogenase
VSTIPSTADHLVIGGGPAGAMTAIRLAAAGRRVTLLEKERGPHHKVCGEFLSREAVEYLRQAGVSAQGLGAAPIHSVRISSGDHAAEAALPFSALSLSRRVLDEAMLRRAEDQGCNVVRGAGVERLVPDGDEWIAALGDGTSIRARAVFLATGKHDLHGWKRGLGRQSDLVGFKEHWRLAAARVEHLRERMELFLFPGGYGGLSLVEGDSANLCFVVRRVRLRALGGWHSLLGELLKSNRRLRGCLEGSQALWRRPLAISPIPYGYFAGETHGAWCVGDQACVIPSFTGDGISIALHSASLAAEMFLAGRSAAEYHRTLRSQLGRGMALSTALSRAMVSAWSQPLAVPMLRLFPQAMRWIAASTRIPAGALRSGRDSSATAALMPLG